MIAKLMCAADCRMPYKKGRNKTRDNLYDVAVIDVSKRDDVVNTFTDTYLKHYGTGLPIRAAMEAALVELCIIRKATPKPVKRKKKRHDRKKETAQEVVRPQVPASEGAPATEGVTVVATGEPGIGRSLHVDYAKDGATDVGATIFGHRDEKGNVVIDRVEQYGDPANTGAEAGTGSSSAGTGSSSAGTGQKPA